MTGGHCYDLFIMWRRMTGEARMPVREEVGRKQKKEKQFTSLGSRKIKWKGQVQASEARRKMRSVLEKKAEARGAGIVKTQKSRLSETENKSGYNNYFGRKMRYLKSKKGINRKDCSPQCYQFSLINTEYLFPLPLSRTLPCKQSSSNIVSRQR